MLISSLRAQESWSSALEGISDLGGKMAHYYPRKNGWMRFAEFEERLWGKGGGGKCGTVKSATLQESFHFGNKSSLSFWPSISQTAHLAPCLIAYLSLQPLLSITQLLHLLLVANLLLRKPQNTLRWIMWEWHLSQLFELREQAAGWEESWRGEFCWSDMPFLARLTLKGGAEGISRELLESGMWEAFWHSKMIRKWGKLLLMGQWIEYCSEWGFSPTLTKVNDAKQFNQLHPA